MNTLARWLTILILVANRMYLIHLKIICVSYARLDDSVRHQWFTGINFTRQLKRLRTDSVSFIEIMSVFRTLTRSHRSIWQSAPRAFALNITLFSPARLIFCMEWNFLWSTEREDARNGTQQNHEKVGFGNMHVWRFVWTGIERWNMQVLTLDDINVSVGDDSCNEKWNGN